MILFSLFINLKLDCIQLRHQNANWFVVEQFPTWLHHIKIVWLRYEIYEKKEIQLASSNGLSNEMWLRKIFHFCTVWCEIDISAIANCKLYFCIWLHYAGFTLQLIIHELVKNDYDWKMISCKNVGIFVVLIFDDKRFI